MKKEEIRSAPGTEANVSAATPTEIEAGKYKALSQIAEVARELHKWSDDERATPGVRNHARSLADDLADALGCCQDCPEIGGDRDGCCNLIPPYAEASGCEGLDQPAPSDESRADLLSKISRLQADLEEGRKVIEAARWIIEPVDGPRAYDWAQAASSFLQERKG